MKIDACCTIRFEGNLEDATGHLVRQMDSAEVDMAVIHPADRIYAWENEDGNQKLLDLSDKYKGRFIPAVTVNPWRSDAWQVLSKFIEQGGRIVSFSPAVQGLSICDNKFVRLCENILENYKNVPVYFHSGHYSYGAPTQLLILAKYFPDLNFILGHSGATDYASDVVPVCTSVTNIYMESSFARPPGFVAKLEQAGFDRGIMGSGYPDNDLPFEWLETCRLLPEEHLGSVCGETLLKLIGGIK